MTGTILTDPVEIFARSCRDAGTSLKKLLQKAPCSIIYGIMCRFRDFLLKLAAA